MANVKKLQDRLGKALALMQSVGFDEIPVQLSQAELGQIVGALKEHLESESKKCGKDEA